MRAQTDRPCGRPAVATILGVRFCERCTRVQTDYFALGELTQVPRGKSGVAEGVGYAARAPRLGYSAGTRGAYRRLVARSTKVSLLLFVASILFLAATACSGTGRQASGGSAATQAKAKPETTAHQHAPSIEVTAEGNDARGALARVGDAGGAVARTGDAVARAGNAQARAGGAAREKHGGAAPGKNTAGEDRFREDRPPGEAPPGGSSPETHAGGGWRPWDRVLGCVLRRRRGEDYRRARSAALRVRTGRCGTRVRDKQEVRRGRLAGRRRRGGRSLRAAHRGH